MAINTKAMIIRTGAFSSKRFIRSIPLPDPGLQD
jgi:hypothetical protein